MSRIIIPTPAISGVNDLNVSGTHDYVAQSFTWRSDYKLNIIRYYAYATFHEHPTVRIYNDNAGVPGTLKSNIGNMTPETTMGIVEKSGLNITLTNGVLYWLELKVGNSVGEYVTQGTNITLGVASDDSQYSGTLLMQASSTHVWATTGRDLNFQLIGDNDSPLLTCLKT